MIYIFEGFQNWNFHQLAASRASFRDDIQFNTLLN